MVKNLPAVRETWVISLDREDSLEKGIAIHSNILAWRISWTEEPGGLQRLQRLCTKEMMLLNCTAGEDSEESLGLQGDQTTQS